MIIKRYNEDILDGYIPQEWELNNVELAQEVSDLFQQYSTYLIDNGFDFDIRIVGEYNNPYLSITLFKPKKNGNIYSSNEFKWADIKEDFSQICYLLNNTYKITEIVIRRDINTPEDFKNDESVIKYDINYIDKISENKVIRTIEIKIPAYSKPKVVHKKKGLLDRFKDFIKR